MESRSEVNIAFADYLYSNCDILNTKKLKNGKYITTEDINHIIIGRLYYGVFLLAKYRLINDFDFIKNCTGRNNCKYIQNNKYCNGLCLKHKSNPKYKIESIWNKIGKNLNKHSDTIKGEELARMRERYEYCNTLIPNPREDYSCSAKELKRAKKLFEVIYNALR